MNISQYYYTRLAPTQKPIYESILSGMLSYATAIKVPKRQTSEISEILNCVLLDNPQIFFIASPPAKYLSTLLERSEIRPNYRFDKRTSLQKMEKVLQYLQKFDELKSKSGIEKLQTVHDHCLEHFSYGNSPGEHAHTIAGPVFHQTAVCEGIAKFVKLALDYLDMKSLIVAGAAKNPTSGINENHGWNIVKLGGKTYHLDVTFDMTLSEKLKRYDYFMLSDEDIKKDHTIMGNVPVCTAKGADYYSANSLVVRTPGELKALIANRLKQGEREVVFKLEAKGEPDYLQNKIMQTALQQYADVFKCGTVLESRHNISQNIFEINFK